MIGIRKTLFAGAIALGAVGCAALPAQAQYWRDGWHHGWRGGPVLGAAAGLAAGAAIAGSRGYYYDSPAAAGYDDGYADPAYVEDCHIERQQVPYGDGRWTVRRVRVCD